MFSRAELEAISGQVLSATKSTSKRGKEKDGAKTGQATCTKSQNKRAKDVEERTFVWEDEEVELLLSSTLEYKTGKTLKGVNWESVKSKYQDIVDIYRDNLPTDANDDGEGDPTQARNKPPIM